MKTKIILITMITLCLVSCIGCRKLVSTEYEKVEVTITDEYHRGTYVTPMKVGSVTTMHTHPAVYKIYFEYNGEEHYINNRDTYEKYKDKIGQTAIGTLEIRTYDNGSVNCSITKLD